MRKREETPSLHIIFEKKRSSEYQNGEHFSGFTFLVFNKTELKVLFKSTFETFY